jgi:TRAP-type C4-dicarboxylate transport system substrate-binding protein
MLERIPRASGLAAFVIVSAVYAAPMRSMPSSRAATTHEPRPAPVPPQSSSTVAAGAFGGTHTLRIGTLAPKNSAVGKMMTVWDKALAQTTNGRLTLRIQWNGTAGLEHSLVAKMKAGDLEGAMLTSASLIVVNPRAAVFLVSGVARDWAELDRSRQAIEPDLDAGFQSAGFQRVGWVDDTSIRLVTRGFAVRRPRDLKGKRVLDCPLSLGAITTSSQGLPALVKPHTQWTGGNFDGYCGRTPELAAMQSTGFDHVHEDAIALGSGATVFRLRALTALPRDLHAVFQDLSQRLGKHLPVWMRRADGRAYQQLAQTMMVVKRTEAERAEWDVHHRRQWTSLVSRGPVDKRLLNEMLRARGLTPLP